MKYSFLTDKGQVREANEDSVHVSSNKYGHILAIVADGMGGHNAGDIASKVAVNKISKNWAISDKIDSPLTAKKWITKQIKEVNQHILKYAENDQNFSGMGTTVVIALVIDEKTIIANVGDSRAYALFNNNLLQITTDQTLVNELLEQGEITEIEAKYHPQKNILMQAVGTSKFLKIDFFEVENNYSKLLLCSDGLTNMVNDQRILEFISSMEVEDATKVLVDEANNIGGHDNITVAILEVGD